MLSDLGKALANVSFKLGIWMGDKGSKIWNGTLIDNGLGKLLGVLGNFTKSSGRDSLKSKLWLLNTENQETNGTSIHNSLSKFMIMLGNT